MLLEESIVLSWKTLDKGISYVNEIMKMFQVWRYLI